MALIEIQRCAARWEKRGDGIFMACWRERTAFFCRVCTLAGEKDGMRGVWIVSERASERGARPGDSPPTKPMFPCCSAVRMTHYTPQQSRDACAALAQPRTDSRDRTTKMYTRERYIYNARKSGFITAANLTFPGGRSSPFWQNLV